MRLKRILWFGYPHKIFAAKSLCTTGVYFNTEMAENFFKLWIARKGLCIMPVSLWITMCISKGKIYKKKNFFRRHAEFYIRPPDSKG